MKALRNQVKQVYEDFSKEELIVNASSRISRNYHVTMARKTSNYYLLLLNSQKINTLIIAQDPYKNDYCAEISSAFSYCPLKNSTPPFSCRVLGEGLEKASSSLNKFYKLSSKSYINLLSQNYKLAKYGVFFFDIFPFPAVKTLLKSQTKVQLSKLSQSMKIFIFGTQSKKLFTNYYSELLKLKDIKFCFHFCHHPAYSRWKKNSLLEKKNQITLTELAKVLMKFIPDHKHKEQSFLLKMMQTLTLNENKR